MTIVPIRSHESDKGMWKAFKGLKGPWKVVVIAAVAGLIAFVARDPSAAGKKVGGLGPMIGKIAEGVGDFVSGLVS